MLANIKTMSKNKIQQKITDIQTRALASYFSEIKNQKVLSPEQEIITILRAQEGCKESFDLIVKSNLRFVISIAKMYLNQGIQLEDLISEGNLGLMKAVKRYDITRGFKFISYAVWWIRQSIQRAVLEQNRIVRLPIRKIESIMCIGKSRDQLLKKLERKPDIVELSEYTGKPESEILSYYENRTKHLSFSDIEYKRGNSDNFSEGFSTVAAIVSQNYEGIVDSEVFREALSKSFSILSDREQEIVSCYFGFIQGFTPTSICHKFEITQKKLDSIIQKALVKMKPFLSHLE